LAELESGANISIFLYYIPDTLYLQGNDLGGTFPNHYCPEAYNGPEGLQAWGIDCEKVSCSKVDCCNAWENCFYYKNEE